MKSDNTSTTSAAIWPWRQSTARHNSGTWKKALLQSVVAAAVASAMYYLGHTLVAAFIWTIAAVLFVSSIFIRSVYRKIEFFGRKLGRIVAILLAWLLLVPFYYLVFWPMALLRKSRSRQIFSPASSEAATSYWLSRPAESATDNYTRQY